MYAAVEDPYCYPGTTILRNKLGIRDAARLQDFEEEISKQRASEPLPVGRLGVSHYRAIHRHLFQDVYAWASNLRMVRFAEGGSVFVYPERLSGGMRRLLADLCKAALLRGLDAAGFSIKAAYGLAELNALHPFRDGNGRAQASFFAILADQAGPPIAVGRIDPERFVAVMIASFGGEEGPLADQIRRLRRRTNTLMHGSFRLPHTC